jgi:hypothetical protein
MAGFESHLLNWYVLKRMMAVGSQKGFGRLQESARMTTSARVNDPFYYNHVQEKGFVIILLLVGGC